jgi:L-amino acid N-acyltransferase YncA
MTVAYVIRPAIPLDVPAINAIYTHYIANTVLLFALETRTDKETLLRYESIRSSGLPYLVAVNPESPPTQPEVLGFCLVAPFRGALAGYRHTVELSLYCDASKQSQGVGSALLTQLIDVLKRPEQFTSEWIDPAWSGDGRVRSIVACMALDETGKQEGWGLKEWYEKRGFEMCGRLKKVGRKFDRW